MPMKRRTNMQAPLAVDVSVGYPEFFSVVAEGCIAGSAHPSATSLREQMEHLKEKENVRGLISVTEYAAPGHEELASVGVDYLHLPTADKCPLSIRDLVAGADFVDAVNATGGVVLVHCKEGIGRTGTMIAGWLVVSRRMDAKAAVDMVRAKRTDSIHQRHQELRIYQLHRVVGCEEHLAQVRAGTFDESTYDYRVLKASCADSLARLQLRPFIGVYYFKWLRHVRERMVDRRELMSSTDSNGVTDSEWSQSTRVRAGEPSPVATVFAHASFDVLSCRSSTNSRPAPTPHVSPATSGQHATPLSPMTLRPPKSPLHGSELQLPKYLQPARSPLWKPKLNFEAYLANALTSQGSDQPSEEAEPHACGIGAAGARAIAARLSALPPTPRAPAPATQRPPTGRSHGASFRASRLQQDKWGVPPVTPRGRRRASTDVSSCSTRSEQSADVRGRGVGL